MHGTDRAGLAVAIELELAHTVMFVLAREDSLRARCSAASNEAPSPMSPVIVQATRSSAAKVSAQAPVGVTQTVSLSRTEALPL